MLSFTKLVTLPALLAASACAQSLSSVLAGNTNLTALTQLLSSYPELTSALGGASNITLLAPSNAAIQTFLASNSSATDSSRITALLQYHVLNGSYPSTSFTGNSTFIRTALTNPDFTTVTGGQRVEGVVANGKVTFISGNLYNTTVSTSDIKFDGGLIHIIERVLVIPPKLASKPSLANAGVTVSALYNLLSTTNLLNTVSDLSDVTIFAPSDKGLTNVAGQLAALSGTDAENVAKYHVVQGGSPYYTSRFTTGGNTTLTTLGGGNLTVTSVRGSNGVNLYYVNGARIVATNWLTSGGVLQIIDNVLSPSNSSTFLSTPSIASDSGSARGSSSGSGSDSSSGSTTSNSTSTGKHNAAGKTTQGLGMVGAVVAVAALFVTL